MPQFAANLTMMYAEHAFLDRFEAAAADGFRAVECLFPYDFTSNELAARLRDCGLRQALFNAPPGDWAQGERGIASLRGRQDEFRHGFRKQAIPYAVKLMCPRLHVMAGLAQAGVDPQEQWATYRANLVWAAGEAAREGIEVLIEPINPRDMPGYLLNRQDVAHRLVDELGLENLGVQMDLFHCQIAEGDLVTKLRRYLPQGRVGHIQIAGVPDRHEPDSGELAIGHLLSQIDATGWKGTVGCEYRPRGSTRDGLGWFQSWRGSQKASEG